MLETLSQIEGFRMKALPPNLTFEILFPSFVLFYLYQYTRRDCILSPTNSAGIHPHRQFIRLILLLSLCVCIRSSSCYIEYASTNAFTLKSRNTPRPPVFTTMANHVIKLAPALQPATVCHIFPSRIANGRSECLLDEKIEKEERGAILEENLSEAEAFHMGSAPENAITPSAAAARKPDDVRSRSVHSRKKKMKVHSAVSTVDDDVDYDGTFDTSTDSAAEETENVLPAHEQDGEQGSVATATTVAATEASLPLLRSAVPASRQSRKAEAEPLRAHLECVTKAQEAAQQALSMNETSWTEEENTLRPGLRRTEAAHQVVSYSAAINKCFVHCTFIHKAILQGNSFVLSTGFK